MELWWLYLMLIPVQHIAAVTWLSLAKQTSLQAVLWDPRGWAGLTGLEEEQVRVCQRQVEAMGAVKQGTELAVLECQRQCHSRHWNCSTLQGLQVFGKATIQGTRESAFIHAISAAGIAFAVSRACSRGELHKCGCKVRGVSLKAFVDSPERSRGVSSSRALMNLHNNEAGRKALLAHMKVEGQCHGALGSCEARTCWKVMPPFRHVGNILKEKFKGAAEVYPKRVGSHQLLVPRSSRFKPCTAHDLAFLRASPDFCGRDPGHGTLGTFGRQCSRTRPDTRAAVLRQGRPRGPGALAERCSCKFCCGCSVQCKQRRQPVQVHGCR